MVHPGRLAVALLLVGTTLAAVGRRAAAQGFQGSTTVKVRVFEPLIVEGNRTLDFGDVFGGVGKTIPVTASTSGRFRVRGQARADVALSYTLPTNLTMGTETLPVGTWTAHWNTANNTNAGTAFVPSNSPTNARLSNGGQLFIFLGGTVTPTANQASGEYTGTVVLTVSYL